jgi:hypothetical protein
VPGKDKLLHLLIGDGFAFGVFLGQQAGTHRESGGSVSSANVFEHSLVTLQRVTLPLFADLGKQAVFDRVPF